MWDEENIPEPALVEQVGQPYNGRLANLPFTSISTHCLTQALHMPSQAEGDMALTSQVCSSVNWLSVTSLLSPNQSLSIYSSCS